MPILADYHMHSSFSSDSETPMETMILKAMLQGLTSICFTEHNDFDYPVAPDSPDGNFLLNPDSYLYDLLRFREKYGEYINIFFGVEIGLQPHLALKNTDFSKAHDYDFIIASSHICNGKDPYYPAFFEGRSCEDAYREYFESILENLNVFSDFDVYGHLDYVVRYSPKRDEGYSYETFRGLLDEILQKIISMGKGIEINTSALAAGMTETNPCMAVLKRYRELGGEIITVGSDAHIPSRIAYGFDRAAEILKECGFQYYTTFDHRKPSFQKL